MTIDLDAYLGQRSVDVSAADSNTPAAWNLPIRHWSPSSFSMLQRCPRQWQERYLHGRKQRPAEAPVTGTAVHRSVEMNFGQKIESHEDIPLPQLLDYFNSSFPIVVEQEQERAGAELEWDTSLEAARKRGALMLGGYQTQVAGRIQPLAVETVLSVDIGLAVPVEGRFDVERIASVIDLKSGKQVTRKPKEDWRIQAAVYGHARGKPVEFHSIAASPKAREVTILTPLEEEQLLVQPSLSERKEQIRVLRALSDMACFFMAQYGPDEPWPTFGRFHNWACDYCGYRGDCPAWRET